MAFIMTTNQYFANSFLGSCSGLLEDLNIGSNGNSSSDLTFLTQGTSSTSAAISPDVTLTFGFNRLPDTANSTSQYSPLGPGIVNTLAIPAEVKI